MRRSLPPLVIAVAFPLVLLSLSLPAGRAVAAGLASHAPGEVLIRFLDPDGAGKGNLIVSLGGEVLREERTLDYSRVRLPEGMTVEEAIDRFGGDPRVAWIEPNYLGWLYGAPQDPHIIEDTPATAPAGPSAWHVFQTNLFHLWRWAGGGADTVRIGIIDSGSDLTHPDLAPNAALSGHYDFVGMDANPDDPLGHGTHVTGIACAVANAAGMAGVAYESEFVGIRVFDEAGNTTVDDLTQGILWAADSAGVAVINMSLGITPSTPVYEAIAHALVAGIIPVAASGNDGADSIAFPANVPGVIAVGATTYDTTVATFSNHGAGLACVAPGDSIWSTRSGGGYEYKKGTSMAAPFVAGVCAVLKNKWPDITASEMKEYLGTIAVDLPGAADGAGLIHFTALEDWTDAPVAPAAKHGNHAYEWLGSIATTEQEPNDPMDADGQDNVYMGKYDRDGGDDGVYPGSLGELPYLPSYMDPAGDLITVTLSVDDRSGPRYGSGSDLHLDTWIDWDTDYAFGGTGEHVLVDETIDPSAAPGNTFTLVAPISVPEKHILGNPLIVRTRLNYGAPNPGPGGEADWGEVEDELVVNFYEDFDIGRHGEAPFMGMGGWSLGADEPPCLNRGVYSMARAPHPPPGEECTGSFESTIRMGSPPMDFTEYTEAHLQFFYCHDVVFPCGPFAMDACRVEYRVGGTLVGSDPIPFGGGVFTKDLSFLCGEESVLIDFVSESDDQGFIGIDDLVVVAFDGDGPAPPGAPAISGTVDGSGHTFITLDWTAVDENEPPVTDYDRVANNYGVRFSAFPIGTAADYFAAQPLTPRDAPGGYLDLPKAPGGAETVTLRSPTAFGSRYGAILVGDEVQHLSGVAGSAAHPEAGTVAVNVLSLNDTSGAPGDTVSLDYRVTNGGNTPDVFEIGIDPSDTTAWFFFIEDGALKRPVLLAPLAPGSNTIVTVKVRIPFAAGDGDTNRVDLTATSSSGTLTFAEDTGLVIVNGSATDVAEGEGAVPIRPEIEVTGANPFFRDTRIRLSLPRETTGALRVYNLAGRAVRTLAEGALSSGIRELSWDGRNDAGEDVSSGVYLMRLEAGSVTETRRVVRVR